MGTNYYLVDKRETCSKCNHNPNEGLHIGKSSYGWTFSFRGYSEDYHSPKIVSYRDWGLEVLNPNVEIIDEYGGVMLKVAFWEMVEGKQVSSNRVHALLHPEGCWVDANGYSFTDCEFS